MTDRERLAEMLARALFDDAPLDDRPFIGLNEEFFAEHGIDHWLAVDGQINLARLADALIRAGVTMPDPPAVCGATTVIAGVEYVCQQGTHSTRGSHWTTRGTGAVHWWDDDEARL